MATRTLKNNRATKILSQSEFGRQILVWLDLALENGAVVSEIKTNDYCHICYRLSVEGVSFEDEIVFEDKEGTVHLEFLIQSRRGRYGSDDPFYFILHSKNYFHSRTIFHGEFPRIQKVK